LCCALVHAPDILFLDEPTTGVDAVSRREFWDLLDRLREGGLTIIVSTPYMDEAVRCDRIALIQKGRILRTDTPAAIEESYPRPIFSVRGQARLPLLAALRAFPHAAAVWPFGEVLHYTDKRINADESLVRRELVDHAARMDAGTIEVAPIRAGIEDAFMWEMVHDGAAA
jgi:ABC-type multidrug transport system ATPase subunit